MLKAELNECISTSLNVTVVQGYNIEVVIVNLLLFLIGFLVLFVPFSLLKISLHNYMFNYQYSGYEHRNGQNDSCNRKHDF